jgi:hypothetical protein
MRNMKHTLKVAVYALILVGVFTGVIGAASATTNIKVADNGHYFEYDGKPLFLLGLGKWTLINKIDVNYTAHNQWYQSYGINYNRITLTSPWYTDRTKQVFPWNRSTTPGANDGGNKFDLNEFDPVFWDRLRGYLQDCEDRGIIVCIEFFDECSVEQGGDPHRWDYHPFNPQNNINNIPDLDTMDASYSSSTGWSESFYNVNNSVLMTLQDTYVQKLLNETSQYGNVIYEMANEYGGEGSTQFPGHFAWPQHWIDFFSDYEAASGVQLLLTNMPFGEYYDQAEYFVASGIVCIDAYRQFPAPGNVQGVNDFLGAHYSKGKPIFGGLIGYDSSVGADVSYNRKRFWTLFVSGGAGSGLKGAGTAGEDTTMEEMLSDIHDFIEACVQFWNMLPNDNLVTSGIAYCLANIGREYVIYLPEGGSVTVDLSDATGTLTVEWYNPRNGTYYDDGTITGGGSESFTPPFSGDAVLHIASTFFDTREGTYPSICGTHTGTIKPTDDITVQKMYTYPCPRTGGHSEYARIWNSSGTIAEGNWSGYEGDWHNIPFDELFILKANETYNYTIRTGSYPQMIHAHTANVVGGTITCVEFLDANGESYDNWIPAIKLYSAGEARASTNILMTKIAKKHFFQKESFTKEILYFIHNFWISSKPFAKFFISFVNFMLLPLPLWSCNPFSPFSCSAFL